MEQNIIPGKYIGILTVIVGTVVMLALFVKVYLTPSKPASEVQSTNANEVMPTTGYERNLKTIDKVNTVADQQKEKVTEANNLMDSI